MKNFVAKVDYIKVITIASSYAVSWKVFTYV